MYLAESLGGWQEDQRLVVTITKTRLKTAPGTVETLEGTKKERKPTRLHSENYREMKMVNCGPNWFEYGNLS